MQRRLDTGVSKPRDQASQRQMGQLGRPDLIERQTAIDHEAYRGADARGKRHEDADRGQTELALARQPAATPPLERERLALLGGPTFDARTRRAVYRSSLRHRNVRRAR